MTKISYIHGTEERQQRAEQIPSRSMINYTAWTEGETRLALLAEQLQILSAYAPEDRELQRAKNLVVDTLYKGAHRAQLPTGIVSGRLATVVAEIRNARELTRPAAGKIFGRKNIGAGISDPLIPLEDCEIEEIEDPYTGYTFQQYADPDCPKLNAFKKILNDHLETAAHHILYEFVTNPNSQPATVATKTVNHRAARATIHNLSKLSNENLRLWIRNGVIRHNALAGAGPLQPEETIQWLIKEAQEQAKQGGVSGIGEIIAILTIVAKILIAIGTAVGAAAALVQSIKQKDSASAQLLNQLQGIGTGAYGPELQDWYGGGTPPGGTPPAGYGTELENIAPWLLIGGGALLLLND